MSSYYLSLKKRCKDLGLSPCHGKGVNTPFLERLLAEHERKEEVENDEIREEETSILSEDEEMIKEHDPSLYEMIRSYVPKVPDFRPQETLRRMKEEPNTESMNWRHLRQELEDINHNEEHLDLLAAINGEKGRRISSYLNEKRNIVSEFIFSYPTLFWLIFHVADKGIMDVLLVSQGKNLPDSFKPLLEKVDITLDTIYSIRDKETAKILHERKPKALGPWAADQVSVNLGIALWMLQNPSYQPTDEDLRVAASFGREEIVRLLLKDGRANPAAFNNRALREAIDRDHNEIVQMLLNDDRVDLSDIIGNLLIETLLHNQFDIFEMLVGHKKEYPEEQFLEVLRYAVEHNLTDIVSLLLLNERVRYIIVLEAGIRHRKPDIVKIALEDPRAFVDEQVLEYARKEGNEEIINILESFKEVMDISESFDEKSRV